MKKLTLTLCAVTVLVSAAYAGPERYSGKEMKQAVETPCPQWYADNEWNVSVWGTYAPTINEWEGDRYLGVDHAWGGGLDAKYFFRRYFGLGVQGFGLAVNRHHGQFRDNNNNDNNNDFVGGALGTFTLRYPIPCSRFAPYAYAGVGGIFGGGNSGGVLNEDGDITGVTNNRSNDGRVMGQYGAGFEVRFTPHIGMINDVAFGHVEGGRNDFLLFRSGVNFAF